MAKTLVSSGFQLSVFDIVPERMRLLVEAGARGAGSPAEASENAEAIIIMVMNASQVEDVLFGDNGAVRALAPGSAVIIMSTIGPEKVGTLAGKLAESGLRVLDAPHPNEIVIAVALSDGGRPHARVGGLQMSEAKGEDGLR